MAIFRAHIETASGRKSVLPVLIERPHAAEVEAELIRRYGYEPGELFVEIIARDRSELITLLLADITMTKTSLERLNQQEPLPEWHIMEALRRLSVLAAQMTYVVTALGFFEQHICAHDFLSALQQNGCCDSPKWRVFPSNAKIRAQPQSRILLFCDAHIKQYAAQFGGVYDPIGVLDIWGYPDER